MYIIILNYESGAVDALDLRNKPEILDVEEYVETCLNYNLSNTEWMTTSEMPLINILN